MNTLFGACRKRKILELIGKGGNYICEWATDTFGKKWKLFHKFAQGNMI